MSRKLVLILLLSVFITSHLGYYALYSYRLYQIREETHRELITRIPDHAFEQIDLETNRSKIRWEEPGKEFRLDGKMYDVARIKKQNGRTILFCYNDAKEEKLIAGLTLRIHHDQKTGSKQAVPEFQTADWIKNWYFLSTASPAWIPIKWQFGEYNEDILSGTRKIIKPPPDISRVCRMATIHKIKRTEFNSLTRLPGFVRPYKGIACSLHRATSWFIFKRPGYSVAAGTGEDNTALNRFSHRDNIPLDDPISLGLPARFPVADIAIKSRHIQWSVLRLLFSDRYITTGLGRAPPLRLPDAWPG